MIKNFKKELSLISNNKRITEKLMVIAIYNEFYNDILEVANDNSKELYISMIEKAFELTVRYFNTNKTRNVKAGRFMRVFFNIIKRNETFNRHPFCQVIDNIENRLNDYNSVMSFVSVIEDFDELILERKVSIMIQFREYANDLLNSINEMFGYDTAIGYELRYSILSVLKTRLSNYLNYCKDKNIAPDKISSNLKVNMIKPVKNLLLQKLEDDSINIDHIQDDNTWDFLYEFRGLEQKIWLMEFIYEITGCNKCSKALNFNKANEICEFLGISKLRYTLTNISMRIRYLNVSQKLNNSFSKR